MGTRPKRWLALAVGAIVIVFVAGIAIPSLISWTGVGEIESTLRNGQAVILFAAAGLGLLSGHWAARTSAGFAGATLVILALTGITSATSLAQAGFGPVIYTGSAALAVALLLAAAATPDVNDTESLRQVITRDRGPVALLAVAALTPVAEAVLVAGEPMPLPARMMLSALVAAGCLIAGTRVPRLDRPRLGWLPAVLLIFGVGAVVRAFVGVWSGFRLIALGLEAVAAVFTAVGAVREVRSDLGGKTEGMTSMLQDLVAMRDEDSRRQAEERERLHEVRSLLAGLHAATGSLQRYEDSLDPAVRRRLQVAVGEELSRLNKLIDPGPPEVTEELELETALMSVVVAEREQGLVVTTDLAHVSVQGTAGAIATLVSDLLVNARVHAPGSRVLLTARVIGEMVTLEVRNWGPELSDAEGEQVFERAYRGARSIADGIPGSGLGLYTARKLARQMHGDLQHRTPAGGGCSFVMTLPAAGRSGTPALTPTQVDEVPEAVTGQPQRRDAVPHHLVPARHGDDWRWPERVGQKPAGKDLARNDLARNDLARNDQALNDQALNDQALNDQALNDHARNIQARNDLLAHLRKPRPR